MMKQLGLKKNFKGVLAIVIVVIAAILIRIFFFEMYKITSISMEPCLLPGDYVLVSKMGYGARLLQLRKFFREKKIEYIRIKGLRKIKKNDILVFNYPRYYSLNDSFPDIYGSCIVKRCYGIPGDTVLISKPETYRAGIKNGEGLESNPVLFPRDPTLYWRLDQYGPLYVPARGQSTVLTNENIIRYIDIIRYENPRLIISDNILSINNLPVYKYTFQYNYYFMLGDNFYGSQDSRYWGFVPYGNVIGRAALVLFSINSEGYGFNKIRWKRFLKLI